jgi:hypothetical protein
MNDAELIACQQIIQAFPMGMKPTLDSAALGLEGNEVEEEQKRRDKERRRIEVLRRSIFFGGTSLDTGDTKFADRLREVADRYLATDQSWFGRSRQRVRLMTFQEPDRQSASSGGGGSGKGRRRAERLTDAQREAMGLASEWLAYQYLHRHYEEYFDENCWVSENRRHFFAGVEGGDGAGFDFLVRTPQADWMYEVKSSLEDTSEFELTANELRVAGGASKDGRRRYRILYIPFVFQPEKWFVLELPNPLGERTRTQFETTGRGSVRLRFERP